MVIADMEVHPKVEDMAVLLAGDTAVEELAGMVVLPEQDMELELELAADMEADSRLLRKAHPPVLIPNCGSGSRLSMWTGPTISLPTSCKRR
jgi:hypothetical protein